MRIAPEQRGRMMRLIDADALADNIAVLLERNSDMMGEWLANAIEDEITEAPTIEAEPVVKCKDCIYFHDYGDGVKNCWSDGGGIFTKDDDFCSHAERKNG